MRDATGGQLRAILVGDVVLVAATAGGVAFGGRRRPGSWLVVVALLVLVVLVAVLLRQPEQDEDVDVARACTRTCVVTWLVAMAMVVAMPTTYPVGVLACLGPALIAVPRMPERALRRLLGAALVVAWMVVVAGGVTDPFGARVDPPTSMIDAFVIVAAPLLVALVLVIGWENHAVVADRSRAVEASRARVVDVAEAERRRIERDLHDGAQQRLHGALVLLTLARRAGSNGASGVRRVAVAHLADARVELAAAVAELDRIVRGLRPSAVLDGGLDGALSSLAARRGSRVVVSFGTVRRYPPRIEDAVWLCCCEAIVNAEKHAGAEARIAVRIAERDEVITFEVRDNGAGFAMSSQTSSGGLRNMTERVLELGGCLRIEPSVAGTTVFGEIPLGATKDCDGVGA